MTDLLEPVAARIDSELRGGMIALITGPSGCGKSTALRLLQQRIGRRNCLLWSGASNGSRAGIGAAGRTSEALIDLIALDVDSAVRLLSRVGLGEPGVFTRPLSRLSDGQRHRAMLSLGLARAASRRGNPAPPVTLLVDEFGSLLDRLGARLLAEAVRAMVGAGNGPGAGGSGVRLVAATAHDDLAGALRPDMHVRLSVGHGGPERLATRAAGADMEQRSN